MKKINLFCVALLTLSYTAQAFCGFYVAKAEGKLFNKSSQVIIVRDEDNQKNTITMANDYQGDFNEFAMVVPVPVVLKKSDIKVVNKDLFEKFDSYSAPRMAQYYDNHPCNRYKYMIMENANGGVNYALQYEDDFENKEDRYTGVSVEAQYEIGEYDILILSATESSGLQNWLTDNGYKIPSKANEVLTPYIKDDMKFFLAKINTKRLRNKRDNYLSPLQLSFTHKKFMLPIRLGMANANGTQDLIVYALTKNGRVETSNYRTKEMPSNINVPIFVKDVFGDFYKSVFSKTWTNNKSASFLEYSWDLDGSNFTKCDPCSTTPPDAQQLVNAGVDWLRAHSNRWGANYEGRLHFTRLHVRYDREHFPQDLIFTETRNKQNFQCRYIMQNPATVTDENCSEVLPYYKKVLNRRVEELNKLAEITWWNAEWYQAYPQKYKDKIARLEDKQESEENQNNFFPIFPSDNLPPQLLLFALGIGLLALSMFKLYNVQKV